MAPQALTPELAAQFGTHRGALIAEVTPGGPAEKAGLRTGDIITKVNEEAVVDPRQLLLAVSQLQPGTSTKIEYLRYGKTNTTEAQLERRPGETLTGRGDGRGLGGGTSALDGIAVADLTPQVREQLKIPERVRGAIIVQVDPTSAAAQQGDVILELDRKPVKSAEDLARLGQQIQGNRLMALIWREGRTQFVVIEAQRAEARR